MKVWLIVSLVILIIVIIILILMFTVFKKKTSNNSLPVMAEVKVGRIDPQNAWNYSSEVQLFYGLPPQRVILASYSADRTKISEGDIELFIGDNNLLQAEYMHPTSQPTRVAAVNPFPVNKIVNVTITYDGNKNIRFFVNGKDLEVTGQLDLSTTPARGMVDLFQQPSVYAGTRNPLIVAK